MRPVSLVILGAGDRGCLYAGYARQLPERAMVTAIAEPRPPQRRQLAKALQLPASRVFADWRELLEQPRLADAAVIALQDSQHEAAALALLKHGYHLLLEKPMATSEAGCRRVAAAARRSGLVVSICHPMRHSVYTRRLKETIAAGTIGDIVTIQHLEPVGIPRQTHAFVRGNWRNTAEATFMLMAKSCHDLDWICHLLERPCVKVASFGGLHHFRPENRPAGAAGRCPDCRLEPECPFSARKIYATLQAEGYWGRILSAVSSDPAPAAIEAALRTGPYGRCVYACDNDVVDHQVVAMEFAGGVTASFTMTAFTPEMERCTHIGGTLGHIHGDGCSFTVHDYRSGNQTRHDCGAEARAQTDRHGGGDFGLMENFISAVAAGRPELVPSNAEATLASHRLVFAAETARLTGRTRRLRQTDLS
jgi:predicted dehydrogenase